MLRERSCTAVTRRLIEDELLRMGAAAANQGFRNITEAALIINADPDALNGITKVLYPAVAERVGSTPTRVERSIREEVGRLYLSHINQLPEVMQFLSMDQDKPCNSEFLARLNIHLRRVAEGTSTGVAWVGQGEGKDGCA